MSESKPTPDQQRAKHAWEVVKKIKGQKDAKKFGGAAKKLPVRIMASGLGQSLAFLRAKDQTPVLLETLGDWVLGKRTQTALLEAVITGTTDSLRQHTVETLAYLQWLNRFCEAEGLTTDEESEQ